MDIKRATFEQLKANLAASDQPTRATAMQELLLRVERDAGIHPVALLLFEHYLIAAPDAWTTTMAAHGIEHISGADRGAAAWQALLDRPEPTVASHAALAMEHPRHIPALLNVLAHRPEPEVHISVVRTLGRVGDPAALEALVGELSLPAVRPHAVLALEDLGDPRAIPHLQPLLQDTTEAWPEDNHGTILTVSHLAHSAIRQLQNPKPRPRIPLPRAVMNFLPPELPPLQQPKPPATLLAFCPLIIAVVQAPWIVAVIFLTLMNLGGMPKTPAGVRTFGGIALFPSVTGLVIATVPVIRRQPLRLVERVCLALGCLACIAYLALLGHEFVPTLIPW